MIYLRKPESGAVLGMANELTIDLRKFEFSFTPSFACRQKLLQH
jgi:hypothetical protein